MIFKIHALITVLLYFEHAEGAPRVDPLVNTNVGLIRGLKATDGDYSMFLGIPYASVDAANPFGPSTPYPKFDATFEAYDDSAICPQREEFNSTLVGTLDCLHLNIYVPTSASTRNPLPVLVWIYGGGFSIGYAGRYLYGPKYLVRHDIILVTLNYRLGAYGFMCLDTPEIPGNQGLKDQLTALRWVKNNIESFGGDVGKITIFGESAGGMSVDFHLLSEQEKLFRNVIIQSGTSLLPDLLAREAETNAPILLAEKLGLITNDLSEALTFLTNVDPVLIIAASETIDYRFIPCIEKKIDNVERFITDNSINAKIPKAKGIPILIGYNNNEQLGNYVNQSPEYFENRNEFYNRLMSSFDFDENKLTEMADIVRHFYIGDEKINEAVKFDIIDFVSDFQFNHPTERSITKYIENEADKVFQYVFSYNGKRNFVKRKDNITVGGASHADEIGYLFDISFMTENLLPEDQLTLDRMTTMWTNFVKYGDPTPETSELLPVRWEPISQQNSVHYYLDIDTELSVKKRPFSQRMAFWDLFYKLNGQSQKGFLEEL